MCGSRPLDLEHGPWWIDGFLSAATCALILEELEFCFWRPSKVVRRLEDSSLYTFSSGCRVSETTTATWFSRELAREVRRAERRVARLLGRLRSHFESWQATRYGIGGTFDFHHDSGYWREEPGGEREYTVLIYLDTPARGGATHFRELDLHVAAQAGRLVLWRNLTSEGECDTRAIHSSTPVKMGRKTTLVTWVRQFPIAGGENYRDER